MVTLPDDFVLLFGANAIFFSPQNFGIYPLRARCFKRAFVIGKVERAAFCEIFENAPVIVTSTLNLPNILRAKTN
jgi:hypothetical protein